MKRTLVILGIILVIILIQISLSKRKNKWAGLVLPVLILIWSFIYPAANTWNHQPEVSLNFVVQLFIMWFTINISTIMLLGIYLGVRKRQR